MLRTLLTTITHNHPNTQQVNITSYNVLCEDGETELIDMVEDQTAQMEFENIEITDLQRTVIEEINTLAEREREIIILRHLKGIQQVTKAAEWGIIPSRQQLHRRAFIKLRRSERFLQLLNEFVCHYDMSLTSQTMFIYELS